MFVLLDIMYLSFLFSSQVPNDYHGNNALILASVNSHKTVVELLINKKANVNYQNKVNNNKIIPLKINFKAGGTSLAGLVKITPHFSVKHCLVICGKSR